MRRTSCAGLVVATLASVAVAAPASGRTVTVQAERLRAGGGVGHVAHDHGRRVLRLTGARAARGLVVLPGPARVAVVARGTSCAGGAARIALSVGDAATVSARVPGGRRRWTRVAGAATVAPGRHALALRLRNPRHARRCTRAAAVDRIVFTPAPTAPPAARWTPGPGTTWQWQLSGTLDLSVSADMYDVDLFDTPASAVAELHRRGRRAVCYLDAGSFEPGRPDAADVPRGVRGAELEGWPGERWLDIRRLDVLGPILERRLDLCAAKGFDGVEADNVDAYANDSGFPLRASDQLAFNRFVAAAAHARGLSAGLKNDLGQVAALEGAFDWALSEQCFQYHECDRLRPFVAAGKAAFVAEYEGRPSSFCGPARAAGLSAIRKRLDLGAWRQAC